MDMVSLFDTFPKTESRRGGGEDAAGAKKGAQSRSSEGTARSQQRTGL